MQPVFSLGDIVVFTAVVEDSAMETGTEYVVVGRAGKIVRGGGSTDDVRGRAHDLEVIEKADFLRNRVEDTQRVQIKVGDTSTVEKLGNVLAEFAQTTMPDIMCSLRWRHAYTEKFSRTPTPNIRVALYK